MLKDWQDLFAVRGQEGNALDARIKRYNVEFKQPPLCSGRPRSSRLATVTAKLRTLDQAMWSENLSSQLKLSCQYHPDNFKDLHDSLVHSLKKNKYLSPALCEVLGIQ